MKRPRYKLFAVVDGERYGLLVKRSLSADTDEACRYFYFEDGLRPTSGLLHVCNEECFLLLDRLEERRFVAGLIAYMGDTGVRGSIQIPRCIRQTMDDAPDYQNVVHHFFERVNSPLGDFLYSTQVFRKCVLAKTRGRDKYTWMAEKVDIVPPSLIAVDDATHLRPIESVLRIDSAEKPKWFRKTGPRARDFDDGMVYRRAAVSDKIYDMVIKQPTSVLVGQAATGKTVLVRQLGYRLYREHVSVHYFDCELESDFDAKELAREIKARTGVFIVENIHCAAQECQQMLDRLGTHNSQHLVLTARPSFVDSMHPRMDTPAELPSLVLEPFDDADGFISYFASMNGSVPWSEKVYDDIRTVSQKNFWLLSYALCGYVRHPQSAPATWVADGVKDDLKNLARQNVSFPEVLVSLAPLCMMAQRPQYMMARFTSEDYLTRVLGCDMETIAALVRQGEITTFESSCGYMSYGLPHTALAEAYWMHGMLYRRRRGLPEHEDFIYDYAMNSAYDGLGAVVFSPEPTARRLLARIMENSVLMQIISKEHNILAIAECLKCIGSELALDNDMLQVLASRIVGREDMDGVFECWCAVYRIDRGAGSKLSQMLDMQVIAARLVEVRSPFGMSCGITDLCQADADAARELCSFLDIDKLKAVIESSDIPVGPFNCVRAIMESNADVGQRLWRVLDKMPMIWKVVENSILWFSDAIAQVFIMDKQAAYDLWAAMDMRQLAEHFIVEESDVCIEYAIDMLSCMGGFPAEELFKELVNERFAKRLECMQSMGYFVSILACMGRALPEGTAHLCDLLDAETIALKLWAPESEARRSQAFNVLAKLAPGLCQQIQDVLEKKSR
jgi:hypothetical protein